MKSNMKTSLAFAGASILTTAYAAPAPLPGVPLKNLTTNATPSYKTYTAIGDSFCSGDGNYKAITGDPTKSCRRTIDSFPYQFWQSHQDTLTTFNFPGCSGADTILTTAQIDDPAPNITGNQDPSVSYGFGSPDIVSITVGGDNDSAFGHSIKACVIGLYTHSADSSAYKNSCAAALNVANLTIGSLQPQLEAVYADAKTRNLLPGQDRKVFVTGYAQFYNSDADKNNCPAFAELPTPSLGAGGVAEKMNQLVVAMNEVVEKACKAQGVTYVDTDAGFEGHRICDGQKSDEFQTNLFLTIEGSIIFHPTTPGYESMAEDLGRAAGFSD